MTSREPFWPFATQAEFDAHEADRRQGYAILASAHEAWLAALLARQQAAR